MKLSGALVISTEDIIFSFLPFSKGDTRVILVYATDICGILVYAADICGILMFAADKTQMTEGGMKK